MEFICGNASVNIDYNKDDKTWGIVISSSDENSEVNVTSAMIYQIRSIFLDYARSYFNMIIDEVYKKSTWTDELKDQINSEILAWINPVSDIRHDKKEES